CSSSRRRHTRSKRDWSSDVCSSDLSFSFPLAAGIMINMQPAVFLFGGRYVPKLSYHIVQLLLKRPDPDCPCKQTFCKVICRGHFINIRPLSPNRIMQDCLSPMSMYPLISPIRRQKRPPFQRVCFGYGRPALLNPPASLCPSRIEARRHRRLTQYFGKTVVFIKKIMVGNLGNPFHAHKIPFPGSCPPQQVRVKRHVEFIAQLYGY